MKDRAGRDIDYIRISITDRCNLRCQYCLPEDGIESKRVGHDDLLRYEEILRVARVCVALGVTHFKITGGEPLVRLGAVSFIRKLKSLPGVETVTLTTNGLLLAEMADDLLSAGIDGINVSLDSLDDRRYRTITRGGDLNQVMAGIRYVIDRGYDRLKVNTLPIAGFNEGDMVPLAGLAKRWPIHVRFIEVMPIGEGRTWEGINPEVVRQMLEEAYGKGIVYPQPLGYGPAEYLSFPDFKGKIGFISAVHNRFCDTCNRVRLTSTGFLKLCLQYDRGIDLRPFLQTEDDQALKQAISTAIFNKPQGHCFGSDDPILQEEKRRMSDIGG